MHGMPGFPQPEAAPPVIPPQSGDAPVAQGPPTDAAGVPIQRDDGASRDAARAAYEASILAVFGGKRGLAEAGLPSVVFITAYTVTTQLRPSLWAAVATAVVLSAARLVKRDKVQHALSGLLGVVVCAVVARQTGQAKDFYLPGVLLNVGEALLFSVSALLRWPVVGVLIGSITGELTAWRGDPARLAAFLKATWLLAAMFAVRVVIEVPLYFANETTSLGVAKVVLGYPLYLAVAFVCWRVIRGAPLPGPR